MEFEAETVIKCKTQKSELVFVLHGRVTHLNQNATEVIILPAICEKCGKSFQG